MKTFLLNLFLLYTGVNFAQNNYSTEELVLRLNFKLLDYAVIDNPSVTQGKLRNFLNEEGKQALAKLEETGFKIGGLQMRKIFVNLTTADSVSISRQGKKVPIPPFWATFVVQKPTEADFYKFMSSLGSAFPLVIYTHPNYRIEYLDVPDDSLFFSQQSLHSFSLPHAHIQVDSAWQIETGKPFIKVGVFDSGIDSLNEDLQLLTGWGYHGPIIAGPDDWGYDDHSHGTSVAGIIGAKRNNGKGIAGIAGGDGPGNPGVSLIDFKMAGQFGGVADLVAAGVIDGARSVGTYYDWSPVAQNEPYWESTSGYGIHLANHSYTFPDVVFQEPGKDLPGPTPPTWDPNIEPDFCHLCREAFLFSLKNGVTNIVGRGNGSLGMNPYLSAGAYPQNFHDSWVISVGGTGYDGNRLVAPHNTSLMEPYFFSPMGRGLDILAPATDSIIVSTKSTQVGAPGQHYQKFNGTSAAAPHATGVAALLMSHYNKPCYSNQNLDPADIEYILQKSATNLDVPGYDDATGWGRLNAHKALKMIQFPEYQIIHPVDLPVSLEVIARDTISFFLHSPLESDGSGPISSQFPLQNKQTYLVEKRAYEATYDFSQYIGPQTQLLDAWVRHSETTSLGDMQDTATVWIPAPAPYQVFHIDTFQVEPMAEILHVDPINHKIRLKGYYYHFIGRYGLGIQNGVTETANFWYPMNPHLGMVNMAYSIYIRDASLDSLYSFPCDSVNVMYDPFAGIHDFAGTVKQFTVYPNPAAAALHVSLSNVVAHSQELYLSDVSGKILYKEKIVPGQDLVEMQVDAFSSGLYFVHLVKSGQIVETQKWIRQ